MTDISTALHQSALAVIRTLNDENHKLHARIAILELELTIATCAAEASNEFYRLEYMGEKTYLTPTGRRMTTLHCVDCGTLRHLRRYDQRALNQRCRTCANKERAQANADAAKARRQAIVEDVEWLTESGESPGVIAARLGRTPSSIVWCLETEGRRDLARTYDRLPKRCAA